MERSDRNRRLAAPSCCKAGVPHPTQGSPTLTGRDGKRHGVWEAQNTHKHREQHVYNGSTTVQSSKSGLNLLKWSGCHTLLCQRRQQATTSCDHERHFAFGGWGKAQRSRQWLRTVVWVPHRVFKKKKRAEKWLSKEPTCRCYSSKEARLKTHFIPTESIRVGSSESCTTKGLLGTVHLRYPQQQHKYVNSGSYGTFTKKECVLSIEIHINIF